MYFLGGFPWFSAPAAGEMLCWECWIAEEGVSHLWQAVVPQPGGPSEAASCCRLVLLPFDAASLGHCFVEFFSLSLACRHYLFPSPFFIQAINHLLVQIQLLWTRADIWKHPHHLSLFSPKALPLHEVLIYCLLFQACNK